jgi:hypothetical protein
MFMSNSLSYNAGRYPDFAQDSVRRARDEGAAVSEVESAYGHCPQCGSSASQSGEFAETPSPPSPASGVGDRMDCP